MIAIDNVLLSDSVVEEQFVCDLSACKGGCCVDGDCGAPLTEEETKIIAKTYPKIKSYLLPEYIAEVEKQGTHVIDDEYGFVTPTINGGICVYAYTDEAGIVKCTFEKAWKEGKIKFQKPISCHLYPIRIKEMDGYDAVNYEPRKKLCKPACKLGRQLKIPVYKFLKDSITRKYGQEFYDTLDAVARKMNADKQA
ncbi:MAG: hypothetical protein BGO70_14015 [Bacteroidetes bacterium 43-93]|nr:DUF3109 family protein [Bacteroidota bacterium]OJW99546.1 MAG: hypothetical protein BGO70_14015 [Bacteroidetes bacterium 43-93]